MTYRAVNPPGVDKWMGDQIPPDSGCSSPDLPSAPSHTRPRLGLALSCGGAKGLAHIGVIQVLEENGIQIDAIAGSSMGAYIGSIWGFGHDGSEMEALARRNEGRFGLRRLMDPVFPPRRGFLRGDKVRHHLEETIGHGRFEDMVRPVRVIATDLQTLERVVFSSGEVAPAVQASIAIPGVCVPVNIEGRTYIDGGIADPIPVDVLRKMGMDRVIAVNTIAPPSFLRCCEEHQREVEALSGRRHGLWSYLGRHLNYFASGNILDTMMRAVHGAQIRVAEAACRDADFVLRPLSIEASWIEFHHPQKYIDLGRRVALENLPAIQALLNGETPAYEYQSAQHSMVAPV
jgi:NTE family protein